MCAARKACTDRATRDNCLLQRLMALSVYQKASCVLSYVSFGTEADTLRILDRVLADGKALYVPKCVPNTNRMVFYRISALRDLSPGAYGILEPKEAEVYQDEASALCLVPGLAFSANGARLGYGKGYLRYVFCAAPGFKARSMLRFSARAASADAAARCAHGRYFDRQAARFDGR